MENVKDDIDEAANLDLLSGSHFQINPNPNPTLSQQKPTTLATKKNIENFCKTRPKIDEKLVEQSISCAHQRPQMSGSKMPGKMKRQLEEYKEINDSEIGCNFFESFMVIGADKKELLQDRMILPPKVFYKYPDLYKNAQQRDSILSHFAFPFGVESKEILMTDSLSQINEIIFSNNIAESNNNCFVFVVKSE